MTHVDSLADFTAEPFSIEGMTFPVYVSPSAGPPVLLLHEIPNLSPNVAEFARHLVRAGFKVFLPSLVGAPGQASEGGLGAGLEICVRREFGGLLGGSTRPVVRWLRALVRQAAEGDQKRKVGVIGMCFSGGFALGAATEPDVAAAVTCQPALPMAAALGLPGAKAQIDLGATDRATLRQRLHNGELAVQGYRFEGDAISPCERRHTVSEALGQGCDFRCIPDRFAAPAPKGRIEHHSVVTLHLVDQAGEPTREARDRIVAFLDWRLRQGPVPAPPSAHLRDCALLGCARGR